MLYFHERCWSVYVIVVFFQAEDGIRDLVRSRGLGDVYKRQLAKTTRFSDGESFCEIGENARGVDAFVIQSTSSPVNDNVMELLIMCLSLIHI